MENLKDEIRRVMASVFEVPVTKVSDDASADSLDEWDSLAQMNLIMALEQRFNIQFNDNETTELLSLELIHEVLKEKQK